MLSHSIASHSRAAGAKSARLLHVACTHQPPMRSQCGGSLAIAFDCLARRCEDRCEVSAAARLLSHSIALHSRAADAKSARLLHVACTHQPPMRRRCGYCVCSHSRAADAKSARLLHVAWTYQPPMRRRCDVLVVIRMLSPPVAARRAAQLAECRCLPPEPNARRSIATSLPARTAIGRRAKKPALKNTK